MAIVAVIMSVNFTACSDDDEDDKQSNTIIGTWEVTGDSDSDEELLVKSIHSIQMEQS